jgi:phage-related minor tail protein
VLLRVLLDGSQVQTDAQRIGNQAGNSMGQRLSTGLKAGMAIGAVAGGVAALLSPLATAADDAFDSIRAGTGATGDALADLQSDFRAVAGVVPDSLSTVSAVVADLNTRTGLTGDGLRSLSEQLLDFSRATGTDAVQNAALATRVFGDWSIATENQGGALDAMLRASQATGIGVDKLQTSVVQFGAPLRQLGFSFEESITLLGKWEKEGVNMETAMAGMRQGLARMAKAGEEPAETLVRIQEEIKNAGSAAEANGLAIEAFGSRAGPDMAAAIREGRFELGDLFETVTEGGETVRSVTEDTEGAAEGFAGFLNTATLALGEFASPLAGFSQVAGPMLYALPALTALLGGGAGLGLTAALQGAGGAIKGFGTSLLGLATGPVGIIIAAVVGLFLAWQTNFLGIRDIIESVFGWIGDVALPWIGGIFDAIAGAVSAAVGVIVDVIGGIVGVVEGVAGAISGFFGWLFGEVDKSNAAIDSLRSGIGSGSGNNVTRGDPGEFARRRGFAEGAWSVPSTGPAIVHAGEMVIPAGPADVVRDWFGPGMDSLMAGAGAGGDQINVYLLDRMEVRTPRDIGAALTMLNETGHLGRQKKEA